MRPAQRRHEDDFDWRDVETWVLMPHSLTKERLKDLEWPEPSYHDGATPFWLPSVVGDWLASYLRAYWLSHPREVAARLAREEWIFPDLDGAARARAAVAAWIGGATIKAMTRLPEF